MATSSYSMDANGIESSLIEWEESVLASEVVKDEAAVDKLLSAASGVISKANFRMVLLNTDKRCPADIVGPDKCCSGRLFRSSVPIRQSNNTQSQRALCRIA